MELWEGDCGGEPWKRLGFLGQGRVGQRGNSKSNAYEKTLRMKYLVIRVQTHQEAVALTAQELLTFRPAGRQRLAIWRVLIENASENSSVTRAQR